MFQPIKTVSGLRLRGSDSLNWSRCSDRVFGPQTLFHSQFRPLPHSRYCLYPYPVPYSLMRLLAVPWSCISRPKLDQRHNSTASSLCCVCSKFFWENETESRLPFSENLKLKVGRFRKLAIGSEKWTCMLCIRLLDKVNGGVFSYISTLKLWGKIHIFTLTM